MNRLILIFFLFINLNYNAFSDQVLVIQEHWNQIRSMSGEFLQTDPDGKKSTGNFYFLKPYLSKFIYDNKTENFVTNESLLLIVDKQDYQIESYYIGQNILKKILSDRISIKDEFKKFKIISNDNNHILSLTAGSDQNDNQINLFFNKNSLNLEKWEIYDEFENKTVLEFTKTKKNIFISENLFVVKVKKN